MVFLKLKPLCTSLLRDPRRPSSETLAQIARVVNDAPPGAFTPALVEYTFFPLSRILRLTPIPDQPNHVLEQIFLVLAALAQHWDPEPQVWDQLVVLATGVVQSKRDEETTLAAVLVLRALIRPAADPRFRAPTTIPVVGKALDALLEHTTSPNHTLQSTTLSTLLVLVRDYIPDETTPLILPGIVSNTTRTALARTPAESISLALDILRTITTRAISDEACTQSGALHDIRSLDDLVREPPTGSKERSPAWLKATSAQLHIALNTLSPLVEHANPIARQGLVTLCTSLVQTCPRTLEASQPLLLSHLLVLAYPALSTPTTTPPDAHQALSALKSSPALPIAAQTSRALALLPHRLTPAHQPTASLLARQLVSACAVLPQTALLATGIQKWGRTLTAALRFQSPSIVLLGDVKGLIEPASTPDKVEVQPYPALTLVGLDPHVHTQIQQVFTSLGKASADQGLFAIEWFVGVGTAGREEVHVAALWCALHLFRGVLASKAGRVSKAARWIGRTVAEMWDDRVDSTNEFEGEGETLQVAEYVKGLNPLTTLLDRGNAPSRPGVNWVRKREVQLQHASLSLQLLATSHLALATSTTSVPASSIYASTLSTNPSITLLQYTLYPLLLSLLSPAGVLASTAHTALVEVSDGLGYASVSNLLLANFDYALEAVARRVSAFSTYAALGVPTRSNATTNDSNTSISVSIQALHVLRTLINLIGRAIVDRATDVLDECFDRLDDFHGYSVVVHALVGVLSEVVAVVGREDEGRAREGEREDVYLDEGDEGRWERFVEWFQNRGKEEPEFDFKEKGKEVEDEEPKPLDGEEPGPEPDDPPPLPASQALTRQIIARGTYFLTHPSPHIRAQILHLLATAAPTLRASALLPTIHASWPFILNRLGDKEPFVVLSAARLVESLVVSVGDFMARRVWEDVWPKFEKMLKTHAETSLIRSTRPSPVPGGYESYGPRALSDLHLSILHTLAGAAAHVEPNDDAVWTLLLLCRRFLIGSPKPGSTRIQRNEWGERQDVQQAAREVYVAVGKRNPDVVWLVLAGTCGGDPRVGEQSDLPAFLREEWDVRENVVLVLNEID